jgi:protein-S-isoprenylcysteine O-methyltransferase Ste14
VSWNRLARRIRVPLGFLLAALYLWRACPSLGSMLCGGGVAAVGLGIRAMASGHVRKNEELATAGPYGYTRNPLYLGSIVIAAGFALSARSWIVVAVVSLMFLAIYLPVIRGEEAFLRERFPAFAEYERRVPRLLPRIGAWFAAPRPPRGGFSRELYLQHREYNALAGALAMMVFLTVKLTVKLPWFSC